MAHVFIGIPAYGGVIGEGVLSSVLQCSDPSKRVMKNIATQGYSILTRNFNSLYCEALNSRENGVTHFCLHHSDIVPEPLWLDKMLTIMEHAEADILSVVSPIKDHRGLSSCAIDTGDPWVVKRLSLNELHDDYPATFTDPHLLVNTGLMLVNFKNPVTEKLRFEFTDGIKLDKETNKFRPVGMSEDWNFSRRANQLGLKIYSTREVRLLHFGQGKFSNDKWGTGKE